MGKNRSEGAFGSLCKIASVLVLGIVMALGGGCSGESREESRSYGHDGYMGYSNSNPNTINRHSTRSYGEDTALIRQVLEPFQGIKDVKISFSGSRVLVTLTPGEGLTPEARARLTQHALETVKYNMPDYKVNVRMARP
ncbi:hypothetical protein ACX93W_25910 [Paenibacillus sp. CAU 1782]